jgi:hypothetical protein
LAAPDANQARLRSLQDCEIKMTFDKAAVLKAANKTAQVIRAERQARVAEWNAQSLIVRFFAGLVGASRPDYVGVGRQEIAERVSFKATFCTEQTISLTDDEIDTIKGWWLTEETLS